MARLEDLTPGAVVKGILPDHLVTVVDVSHLDHVSPDAELRAEMAIIPRLEASAPDAAAQ